MSHWTAGPDDPDCPDRPDDPDGPRSGAETDDLARDADDGLVRPFTITRGRTVPGRADLGLITVVTTVAPGTEPAPRRGIEPEHRMILRRCRTPTVIAELAATLNLPVSVIKILITDLLESGLVAVQAPAVAVAALRDRELLTAVRDALRQL